jgi:hypothetical protein
MTLYKAMFSLPKHPFGTVQDLDPADHVVAQRVKLGMLVAVTPPGETTPVWATEAPRVEAAPVEATPDPAPKKRAARKKPEPEVETSDPDPEVEVEGSDETPASAQPDTITVEAPSSVMTSWNLSD